MHPAFTYPSYLLKRQVFALTGKLRFYDPHGNLAMFVEQRMFRLREDIRVYADEAKAQEILLIKARQILDWAAAYDVVDSQSGEKVGVLRRKGWKSVLRDEWQILNAEDQPLGVLVEDSLGQALLRRLVLGTLLPQRYEIVIGNQRVADLRQKFHPFAYQMTVDFGRDVQGLLDRRLGIAAAVLLAIIEGKQSDY